MNKKIISFLGSQLLFISICFMVLLWMVLFNSHFFDGAKLALDLTADIPIAVLIFVIFMVVAKIFMRK